MKKILACISSVVFCLLLCGGAVTAQSGSGIKFNVLDHPLTTDKNLVSVSTIINAKQSDISGIHFTLIIKNNSGTTINLKNVADQLSVSLYNERGLNIAVPNDALGEINRAPNDRRWKFRSESVVLDQISINGRKESGDLKTREYIQIPASGDCKVNLIIKNVKKVETPGDVNNRVIKPTIKLAPGRFKLRMWLSVLSKDQNKSGRFIANFQSPMIDIDYIR